ncbi:MAG: phosphodiesterase [Robiginitomaculum sp.]|nr:MAG: phosphodiesterase [Robiginitomaculum sp.]
MIIAQISDLHIGYAGQGNICKNAERLRLVVGALNGLKRKPDLVVATGDLVEKGIEWAYTDLKNALKQIEAPVYLAFGNHDRRQAFGKIFPEFPYADGFLQYTIEDHPVRVIVLDTLDEGRHGGSFCQTRAQWLDARLAEQPKRPTVIAMHHPPIRTGIDWLTIRPGAGWVQRLNDVLSRYDNVKHILAGHIHRSIFKSFAGVTISVSQAIAPQAKLELADIDPDVPDGRILLVEAQPGFCLHLWNGEDITTHSAQAPCGKTLLRYDKKFAHVVRHTLDLDH